MPYIVAPGMQIMDTNTQAKLPRETRELPAMDAQFGVDTQGRLLSSLQEAANDFNRAMSANGYLRARAIRMRLLHQHICLITGLQLTGPLTNSTPSQSSPATCYKSAGDMHGAFGREPPERLRCMHMPCSSAYLCQPRAGMLCLGIFCLKPSQLGPLHDQSPCQDCEHAKVKDAPCSTSFSLLPQE